MLVSNHVPSSMITINDCVMVVEHQDSLSKCNVHQKNGIVFKKTSGLGLGNEECFKAPSVRCIARMIWKRNVVLSLTLVRFYDSMPTIDMLFSIVLINIC